jgi:hypothetical protein
LEAFRAATDTAEVGLEVDTGIELAAALPTALIQREENPKPDA